ILILLSITVLVDMINGFFLMQGIKTPLNQIFKFAIVFLFIIRLSVTEYFWFIVLILALFLLAPLIGLMKHLNLNWFYEDVVVATKWFNVPLSFFYFKNLIQRPQFVRLKSSLKIFLKSSF